MFGAIIAAGHAAVQANTIKCSFDYQHGQCGLDKIKQHAFPVGQENRGGDIGAAELAAAHKADGGQPFALTDDQLTRGHAVGLHPCALHKRQMNAVGGFAADGAEGDCTCLNLRTGDRACIFAIIAQTGCAVRAIAVGSPFCIPVTQGGDAPLRQQDFLAARAVIAFGQPGLFAKRLHCRIDNHIMSQSGDDFLCDQDNLTASAMTAFG